MENSNIQFGELSIYFQKQGQRLVKALILIPIGSLLSFYAFLLDSHISDTEFWIIQGISILLFGLSIANYYFYISDHFKISKFLNSKN